MLHVWDVMVLKVVLRAEVPPGGHLRRRGFSQGRGRMHLGGRRHKLGMAMISESATLAPPFWHPAASWREVKLPFPAVPVRSHSPAVSNTSY